MATTGITLPVLRDRDRIIERMPPERIADAPPPIPHIYRPVVVVNGSEQPSTGFQFTGTQLLVGALILFLLLRK